MGLLGLHNLVMFSNECSELAQAVVAHEAKQPVRWSSRRASQKGPDAYYFPFALSGLSITKMLVNALRIPKRGEHFQPSSAAVWDTPLMSFFCCVEPPRKCGLDLFEQAYCLLFRKLIECMERMPHDVKAFNSSLRMVECDLHSALHHGPCSFAELDELMRYGVRLESCWPTELRTSESTLMDVFSSRIEQMTFGRG